MSEKQNTTLPVEGSIAWAMNRGMLFHVEGIGRYGQTVTSCETPEGAANCVLYRSPVYSVWLAPGTVLTVWNFYAGGSGCKYLKDPERFIVRDGKAVPEAIIKIWLPLERAVKINGDAIDTCADFMYMGESPAGTFQYKHRGTRNYANLRMDSPESVCVAELAKANSNERTWGKAFDFEYAGVRHA